MKLPNFYETPFINELRSRMNAFKLGNLIIDFSFKPIKLSDLICLQQGDEIEKEDFAEIRWDNSNTLVYKNIRIIIYIRDYDFKYKLKDFLPKFHISYCNTLQKANESKRFERYVICTRDDGNFKMHWVEDKKIKLIEYLKLPVCKYCLSQINWKGYGKNNISYDKREEIYREFSIKEYFEKYSKDLIGNISLDNSDSSPLNSYSDDWGFISKEVKKELIILVKNVKKYLPQNFYMFIMSMV